MNPRNRLPPPSIWCIQLYVCVLNIMSGLTKNVNWMCMNWIYQYQNESNQFQGEWFKTLTVNDLGFVFLVLLFLYISLSLSITLFFILSIPFSSQNWCHSVASKCSTLFNESTTNCFLMNTNIANLAYSNTLAMSHSWIKFAVFFDLEPSEIQLNGYCNRDC